MELKIRNIDSELVYAIDQKVKEINQKNHTKISRNEFIKRELHKLMLKDFRDEANDKVQIQLKAMSDLILENDKALGQILSLVAQGEGTPMEDASIELYELGKSGDQNAE